MKLDKNIISERYKDYDDRIIDFLNNIYEDVKAQNTVINNYFLVMYDLLANQLKLYYMALDAIDKEKTLAAEDNYRRVSKSPHIMVLNKSHDEIMKILEDFSLSPFNQAKLKRIKNVDGDDAEALMNNLIS